MPPSCSSRFGPQSRVLGKNGVVSRSTTGACRASAMRYGQSASRQLCDLASERSTDALRIALPPDGRIGARCAIVINLCIEQVKLAFERRATLFRGAMQQILEAGPQPPRHL